MEWNMAFGIIRLSEYQKARYTTANFYPKEKIIELQRGREINAIHMFVQ